MTTTEDPRLDHAALAVLVILQTLMLGALFTLSEPHPPATIPMFALGPFLSAAIAVGTAAIILGGTSTRLGRGATLLAAGAALVSYGPQKWFDVAIAQIWPAVELAELACIVLIARAAAPVLRGRPHAARLG